MNKYCKGIFFILFLGVGISQANSQNSGSFELLHLWVVDIEAKALSAISDPVKDKGTRWTEQGVKTNFYGVRTEYAERMAIGAPPTGVFWIGGEGIKSLVSNGTFRLIEDQSGVKSFSEILRPEIYKIIKYQDGITALPVGIHLQNHVVYNAEILQKLDEDIPESWDEFIQMAEKAKGMGYYGLSISDERWQVKFLISSILAEQIDADRLQRLIRGSDDQNGWKEPLIKSFEILDRLRPYVNDDYNDLPWSESVDHVIQGRSVANFLGDFSSPLYKNSDKFICDLPPGNDYVLWSFDTIALTNTEDEEQKRGQDSLISVLSQSMYNTDYVIHKGGIPAYRDVNTEKLNKCSQTSVKNWENATARVHLGPNDWSRALNLIASAAQSYWNNENTDLNKLVDDVVSSLEGLQ